MNVFRLQTDQEPQSSHSHLCWGGNRIKGKKSASVMCKRSQNLQPRIILNNCWPDTYIYKKALCSSKESLVNFFIQSWMSVLYVWMYEWDWWMWCPVLGPCSPQGQIVICEELFGEFDLSLTVYCSKFFFHVHKLMPNANQALGVIFVLSYVIMVEPFLSCNVICYLFIIITLHVLLK